VKHEGERLKVSKMKDLTTDGKGGEIGWHNRSFGKLSDHVMHHID
jgi:hypothetical protein